MLLPSPSFSLPPVSVSLSFPFSPPSPFSFLPHLVPYHVPVESSLPWSSPLSSAAPSGLLPAGETTDSDSLKCGHSATGQCVHLLVSYLICLQFLLLEVIQFSTMHSTVVHLYVFKVYSDMCIAMVKKLPPSPALFAVS